jgi:hypothetical protein
VPPRPAFELPPVTPPDPSVSPPDSPQPTNDSTVGTEATKHQAGTDELYRAKLSAAEAGLKKRVV